MPTAPTAATPQPGPGVSTVLRWDIKAPACQSTSAPNPLPDPSSARMTNEPDGSITASYPYTLNGRSVLLYANFVPVNGAWAVCSWDTADVF
jgi:hypothetical protein